MQQQLHWLSVYQRRGKIGGKTESSAGAAAVLVHVSAAWRRQRPGCCAAVPHLLELCEPLRVSCTRPDGGEGGQVLRSCTDGLHNGLQGAWQSLAQLTGGVHTSKVFKGGCMASNNHTGGTGAGEHVASGGCGGVSLRRSRTSNHWCVAEPRH